MQIQNIDLRYGNRRVLSNVSLTIQPGEFIFLIGAS